MKEWNRKREKKEMKMRKSLGNKEITLKTAKGIKGIEEFRISIHGLFSSRKNETRT